MPLNTRPFAPSPLLRGHRPLACAVAALALLASTGAWAQNFPITATQRATADQVAATGVALSELAPNAPESHTVKRGDTLWAISKIFLKSPWRWPELWGMNRDDIKNPHRIYPGQVLYLDTSNGRARLGLRKPGGGIPEVRVSPRVRSESLSDSSIPPVNMQAIEAFLAEPLIVDAATFAKAARIVAAPENRVLLSLGDRAYARAVFGDGSDTSIEPLSMAPGKPRDFRVFRNATQLKDPGTGEILGYEAQFVGKAQLVRSESSRPVMAAPVLVGQTAAPAKPAEMELVPATIDIVRAKEEMRVGDRLLPEPPRDYSNYVPSAPATAQNGQIVSVYGNAVRFASQNQVVSINRGTAHGLQNGHVLALIRDSNTLVDSTDESRPVLRLPGERNGLMMVFRTFDKLSYALVLDIEDAAKVGDRFSNP